MSALKRTARTMVMTLAIGCIVALASFSFVQPAHASDATADRTPSSYQELMKMKPMDVMHMCDTHHKGFVTKEEFMKFHEALFDKMDKNKDRQIAEKEWLGASGG